jgi:hypothetical protein
MARLPPPAAASAVFPNRGNALQSAHYTFLGSAGRAGMLRRIAVEVLRALVTLVILVVCSVVIVVALAKLGLIWQ